MSESRTSLKLCVQSGHPRLACDSALARDPQGYSEGSGDDSSIHSLQSQPPEKRSSKIHLRKYRVCEGGDGVSAHHLRGHCIHLPSRASLRHPCQISHF